MTRHLDVEHEQKETSRREEIIQALEFRLAGAIEFHGGQLRGFSIKYHEWDCMLTLKVSFEEKWFISNVSSDTMTNCILRATRMAQHGRLGWRPDQYQPKQD